MNDDILYKIDSEIGKDKKVVELQEEIERLGNELQVQIEDNVRLNEYIEEKGKEIERLNKELKFEKLKNKEVREYIEKYEVINGYYDSNYDGENDTYTHYTVKEELLKILDKENK